MKKKIKYIIIIILILLIGIYFKQDTNLNKILEGTIITIKDNKIYIEDNKNRIYIIKNNDDFNVGDNILIEYTGKLERNKSNQNIKVINIKKQKYELNEDGIPTTWDDSGLFKKYYDKANQYLKKLSPDERIGQLLLVRYPDDYDNEIIKKYQFGGYIFFERDFDSKTKNEVIEMIGKATNNSNTPLLTAVDEEGGLVTRISYNENLVTSPFKSPRELFNTHGFKEIKKDNTRKNKILAELGLNVNLAPVVDLSNNTNDYMYDRAFSGDPKLTAKFAKIIINNSKNSTVSYVLKHFPGYGNNVDTHTGTAIDKRTLKEIKEKDLVPFKEGIKATAEAILISHNIVNSIDENNPASLSTDIHNLLRDELNFTGIIITDDIAMGATSDIKDSTVKAILSGNDLIITTDYEQSIKEIKNAIKNNVISEKQIDKIAFRIISWKYYKGLLQ